MNERIKELMDEAVRFRLDPDSKQYEAQVSPEDLEVFAELIVRECARVASDRVMDVEGNDWGVRWAIKNHFGVEQ
jgi:hypothetical protein